MGTANKERANRWWHDDGRASFYAKRSEARDDDRRVHGINTATAGCIHRLIINSHELRPAFLVRLRDHCGRKAIAFQRDGNAQVERSEEHTSELQSRRDLVCRLLL